MIQVAVVCRNEFRFTKKGVEMNFDQQKKAGSQEGGHLLLHWMMMKNGLTNLVLIKTESIRG